MLEGNFGLRFNFFSNKTRAPCCRAPSYNKRVDTVANMGRVRTKTVKKVRVSPSAP